MGKILGRPTGCCSRVLLSDAVGGIIPSNGLELLSYLVGLVNQYYSDIEMVYHHFEPQQIAIWGYPSFSDSIWIHRDKIAQVGKTTRYGGFRMGVAQNGWFLMEHTIKMDDILHILMCTWPADMLTLFMQSPCAHTQWTVSWRHRSRQLYKVITMLCLNSAGIRPTHRVTTGDQFA